MTPVVNQTNGTVVTERVGHARSFSRRFRGGCSLRWMVTPACSSSPAAIHTPFMQFPIDAVFPEKQRHVVKVTTVKPWRAALSKGHSVVLDLAERAALVGVETADLLSIEQFKNGQDAVVGQPGGAKI